MLEKVQEDRARKLEQIRQLGIDPYGGRYDTAEPVGSVLSRHEDGAEGQTADIAGRLVLIRDMGKMIFAHVRDMSAQMQIALRKNALDETAWQLAKLLDLGDIIAVAGLLQKSKTGEITIWADRLTLLTKSLNPMPEKFHGLVDTETRYRQRYLDLMTNPESMSVFKQRIAILDHFRDVLTGRGYVEVETPTMQPIYGGAAARPFTTHHNALDCDLFLRISPELYLKRLLVGGMERVFELSRVFRNEGLSTDHSPEYTLLELYEAYADYDVMMDITEELIATAAEDVILPPLLADCKAMREAQQQSHDDAQAAKEQDSEWDKLPQEEQDAKWQALLEEYEGHFLAARAGPFSLAVMADVLEAAENRKSALPYGDRLIDYTRPWPRAKYGELMKEHAGVDMADAAAVRAEARRRGIDEADKDDAVVIHELFEAAVEPTLAKLDTPMFVLDYPAALCPLTRRKADDPSVALRFELYIADMEIANAYTELNDPAVQEANFRGRLRGEDSAETMRVMDEDFVTALRHGMPPAGGLGIGVDRVVMLLTGRQSIRDVMLFPMLRPEASQGQTT